MTDRVLHGITWGHTRGLDPLLACSAVFEGETGVKVEWNVRGLQGFADDSLRELSRDYDLVIFDHPHLGQAIEEEAFVPLSGAIPNETIQDWADNSVGPSYDSYVMAGALWGAPIDAAGTVAAWRRDLLEESGVGVPQTWFEVMELARSLAGSGRFIATALKPIDAITAFLTIVANSGAPVFEDESTIAPRGPARAALLQLAELVELSHPKSLQWSPINVLEAMSTTQTVVYCPLLFGYSNYARPGFRTYLVEFGHFPTDHASLAGGILGGAGLGVSRWSQHQEEALEFVTFVCGSDVQRGLYFEAGGQPGHRTAWTDEEANRLTRGYFESTLPTMDLQVVRPRHNGYLLVQNDGGRRLHNFLRRGGDIDGVLNDLDTIHALSRDRS